ncbi:MAG: hypothetical protein AB7D57_06675 [Desulfovibrionaceae bacterium]
MVVVGISGKVGCGKSTVARLVEKLVPGGVTRLSFASELKDELSRVFDFPRWWFDTPEGKGMPVRVDWSLVDDILLDGLPLNYPRFSMMSIRGLLQVYGTNLVRRVDPDRWVRAVRAKIAALPPGAVVVIDDVRFPNEVALVRELGGLLARLDPYPGWKPGDGADHESETALDDWTDWDLREGPAFGDLDRVAERVAVEIHVRKPLAQQVAEVGRHGMSTIASRWQAGDAELAGDYALRDAAAWYVEVHDFGPQMAGMRDCAEREVCLTYFAAYRALRDALAKS